ncbi:MAG: PfkB family carbohydrate kinase [Pseudomonadota bacterium]
MSDILVAGLATIDVVFNVNTLPTRPEKYAADDAAMVGGGGAANAAVALARLGAQPLLLSRVGGDAFAPIIIRDLAEQGVDCSLVTQTHNARSSFSSVLVDVGGERQIVNFRGIDLAQDPPSLNELKVSAVLCDTRWTAASAAALQLAQHLGVPGVLDAEAPVSTELVRLASHVAFSAQGLRSYTNESRLPDALLQVSRATNAFVCVTDGANGVLVVTDNQVAELPVYTIDAVDTLGAGDVWHAAFTYKLAARSNEYEAISFANMAAAIKCMRSGGGRMSPTLAEVQQFKQQRGEH